MKEKVNLVAAGGNFDDAIRSMDWGKTPLGPIEQWPQALRVLVNMVLVGTYPMWVIWGREKVIVYNAPFAHLLGNKHPHALGQPFDKAWPELADQIKSAVGQVFAGESVHLDEIAVMVEREGREEQRYLSLLLATACDDRGEVIGAFGPCLDITEKVSDLKRRQQNTAFIAEVNAEFARLNDSDALLKAAVDRIGLHFQVSDVCLAEIGEMEDEAVTSFHRGRGTSGDEWRHLRDYMSPACVEECRKGEPVVINDTDSLTAEARAFYEKRGIRSQIHVPFRNEERWTFLLTLQHESPRTWTPDEIELFRSLTARIWLRLERSRTEDRVRESEKRYRDLSRTLEQRVAERTAELQEKADRLRHLAAELSSTEQRERKRLAALLHDDLQQLLVAARIQLTTAQRHVHDEKAVVSVNRAAEWIEQAAGAARNLTQQLRPPALYEDNLAAAFHGLAFEMKERHGLTVKLEAAEDASPLPDDVKALLYECVRELLFNTAKHADVDVATVAIWSEENCLHLRIVDEGQGFDMNAFESSRSQGGFGWFSVRERLAALDGNASIQSKPGIGTQVDLRVPLEAGAACSTVERPGAVAQGEVAAPAEKINEENFRVVVVDDHPIVREGIATVIESDARMTVVGQASDGSEAIEVVQDLKPDVVLIDINMPRMNGIEATRLISQRWPEVRVIGLSVQDDETTAKAMLDAGASEFVPKSGDSGRIVSSITGTSAGD